MDDTITNGYYLEHYFNFANAGKFLLVVVAALAAVLAVILLASRLEMNHENKEEEDQEALKDTKEPYPGGQPSEVNLNYAQRQSLAESEGKIPPSGVHLNYAQRQRVQRQQKIDRYQKEKEKKQAEKQTKFRRHRFNLTERFYEMCFSSTSILFFLSLYNVIDWHMPAASAIWTNYQDVILLVFIILSVFLTSLFDVVLVKLPHVTEEEKAEVRLTSSFYIVLMLLYIRFIYQDTNYNQMILYFLTLAAGRFFYFDFTVKDFVSLLKGIARNLPIMGLMCVFSAIVCWYGFYSDFLLTSNGVIISAFIAHLFMVLSIFVIDKTRIMKAVI